MDETALRQLLLSTYGQGIAETLVDRVSGGEPLVLRMEDGSFQSFADAASVKSLIKGALENMQAA